MHIIQNKAKQSTLLAGVFILLVSVLIITVFSKPIVLYLLAIPKVNLGAYWLNRFFFWICLLLIFLYARFIEEQPLLIIKEKKYDLWVYIVSVFAIFGVLVIGLLLISKILIALKFKMESEMLKKMMLIFRAHKLFMIFTAITAGFVEELTFRGYLLPRLALLVKSPLLAILISSALFGLIHFGYGTLVQIIGPFFIGLVFAIYYWNFRNIKVLIFFHCAWDLLATYLRL